MEKKQLELGQMWLGLREEEGAHDIEGVLVPSGGSSR